MWKLSTRNARDAHDAHDARDVRDARDARETHDARDATQDVRCEANMENKLLWSINKKWIEDTTRDDMTW